MCSIPCHRFVWLSQPQLQQARAEFPEIRLQKWKSLVPEDCAYICRRGCHDHAGARRVTVEPSLLQQKYGNVTNGRMFLLYFMVTKFVSYFQRMPPQNFVEPRRYVLNATETDQNLKDMWSCFDSTLSLGLLMNFLIGLDLLLTGFCYRSIHQDGCSSALYKHFCSSRRHFLQQLKWTF